MESQSEQRERVQNSPARYSVADEAKKALDAHLVNYEWRTVSWGKEGEMEIIKKQNVVLMSLLAEIRDLLRQDIPRDREAV